MTVDSILDIKRKNLKSIIDHIRFHEVSNKKDVARDLNLSFATISNMVNSLKAIGAAKEMDITEKTVGRLPKGFALIPGRFIIVTIDVCNEDTVILRAVDLSRQIVKTETYNMILDDNLDRYIAQMQSMYLEFVEPFKGIIGVALITPNTIDYRHGIVVGSRFKIFHMSEVRERLEEALAVPVFIGNDTDLAAYFRACERGSSSLVYIYFDLQGLGIGVIMNGNILMSANGYSPEICHVPFGRLDHTCKYCGQRHCLQEDLMHLGFLTKYHGHLVEAAKYTQGMWDAYVEAVRRQEPRAVEIAQENALLLNRVLSVVFGLFRPELLIVGGLEQPLFDIIAKAVDEHINARDQLNMPVRVLRDDDYHQATALGAAEYVYANWMPDIDKLAIES